MTMMEPAETISGSARAVPDYGQSEGFQGFTLVVPAIFR